MRERPPPTCTLHRLSHRPDTGDRCPALRATALPTTGTLGEHVGADSHTCQHLLVPSPSEGGAETRVWESGGNGTEIRDKAAPELMVAGRPCASLSHPCPSCLGLSGPAGPPHPLPGLLSALGPMLVLREAGSHTWLSRKPTAPCWLPPHRPRKADTLVALPPSQATTRPGPLSGDDTP